MEMLKSEGKCIYCSEMKSRGGMTRHLTTHLSNMEKEATANSEAFLVKVSVAEMFLYLLVDGNKQLEKLDQFLRAIWLECCGHMSSFNVKGKRYFNDYDDMGSDIGEKKSQKMKNLFQEGMTIDYEYDFGSTTHLQIDVLKKYNLKVKDSIELLTRNEPLPILCHQCGKEPAVEICVVHVWQGEGLLCKACAKKHKKTCEDFADYAALPVVNSPRMGICAYEGGMIDTERDGVYKK